MHITAAIESHSSAQYILDNTASSTSLRGYNKFLGEFGYTKIERTDTAKDMFEQLQKEAKTLTTTAKAFVLGLQRFRFFLMNIDKKAQDIHEHAEDLNREHEKNNTDQAQLDEVIKALKQKHAEEKNKPKPDSHILTKIGLAENRLLAGNVFDSCELLVQDALGLLTDAPGPAFLQLYQKGGPDKVKFFLFV